MASFGERTCEVCGGLDGQRFKLTDIQYGVNFPPVHPNCRCTTVGWDEADEEPLQLEGQQQLDYEEWKKLYVDDRVEVEIPIQPEPPVPVVPVAQNASVQTLTAGGDSGIIFTKKQYGKKMGEHARQWGLDPSLKEDRNKLESIIKNIFDNPDEIRIGSYRSQPYEVLFFAKGEDVVVTKQNNEYITVLKGGVHCARFKNARKRNF